MEPNQQKKLIGSNNAKMLLGMDVYPNGCITPEAERRRKQYQERKVG